MAAPLKLILASASPRRADLLRECGIDFEIVTAEVNELSGGDDLSLLPMLNARLKAGAVADIHRDKLVLGADTMILFENRAMGKPADLSEAREMLRTFSGKTHQVITGIALICREKDICRSWSEVSEVTFKTLDETVISRYLDQVEVLDKAGAYAIQEHGELIIERYSGELANIIGLPQKKLCRELARSGITDLE